MYAHAKKGGGELARLFPNGQGEAFARTGGHLDGIDAELPGLENKIQIFGLVCSRETSSVRELVCWVCRKRQRRCPRQWDV